MEIKDGDKITTVYEELQTNKREFCESVLSVELRGRIGSIINRCMYDDPIRVWDEEVHKIFDTPIISWKGPKCDKKTSKEDLERMRLDLENIDRGEKQNGR